MDNIPLAFCIFSAIVLFLFWMHRRYQRMLAPHCACENLVDVGECGEFACACPCVDPQSCRCQCAYGRCWQSLAVQGYRE